MNGVAFLLKVVGKYANNGGAGACCEHTYDHMLRHVCLNGYACKQRYERHGITYFINKQIMHAHKDTIGYCKSVGQAKQWMFKSRSLDRHWWRLGLSQQLELDAEYFKAMAWKKTLKITWLFERGLVKTARVLVRCCHFAIKKY